MSCKKYTDQSVYEASQERIKYLYENFDTVLVSFSGGKDSTACLNLIYDYAKEHNLLHRTAVYHLDYEAQYQFTTDFVTSVFDGYEGIEKYWLCLPVGANCGCRMDAGTWIPWKTSDKNIWVRDLPDSPYLVSEANCPFEFAEGEKDYKVQDKFVQWFTKSHGKTALVIGIRCGESMDRYQMITGHSQTVKKYDGKCWIVDSAIENIYRSYIIYDWEVSDIWTYFAKTGHPYNKLYDLYYQAGLTIDQMRVANPFHTCGTDSLRLYKVIEPDTWGKLVSRVNGVNFAGIYGGTTAMGWKSITLPPGHTWKSYCEFLISTLDEATGKHYREKLDASIRFWREVGGCLEEDVIAELAGRGEICGFKKGSNKRVVKFAEYPDDLDIPHFREVPSYKRMCVCILKNDYFCKYMGFAQTKCEAELRKNAMKRYSNL